LVVALQFCDLLLDMFISALLLIQCCAFSMLALAFSPRMYLGSQLENRPPAHLVPVSCTEQPDCGILRETFDHDRSLFATVTSSRVRNER
jgi:hypothetical protein